MNCANCKSEIADTSKFCKICGAQIASSLHTAQPQTKTCPTCGAENSFSAKFCRVDGYRFETQGLGAAPVPGAQSATPVTDEQRGSSATGASTASNDQPAPDLHFAPAADPERTLAPRITSIPGPTPATAAPPASGDVVLCPSCGTPNPATAKFCRKDGTLLVTSSTASTAPRPETSASAMPLQQPPTKATPLRERSPSQEPASAAEPLPESRRHGGNVSQPKPASSKSRVAIVATATAFLIALGGGSYWYLKGRAARIGQVAETPQPPVVPPTVAAGLPADQAPPPGTALPPAPDSATLVPAVKQALAASGFSSLDVSMGPDLVATLQGTVANDQERAKALAIAQSVRGVKAVNDRIQIATVTVPAPVESPPAPAETVPQEAAAPPANPSPDARAMARDLGGKLRAAGLGGVLARVGPDRTINLTGTVASAQEKNEAIRLAFSTPGSNGIRENLRIAAPPAATANSLPPTSVDPAKLEGELNRALRSGGVGGVTAQVGDDLSLTLKGSGSAAQKETAMRIARNFKDVKRVRDQVFVVEQ